MVTRKGSATQDGIWKVDQVRLPRLHKANIKEFHRSTLESLSEGRACQTLANRRMMLADLGQSSLVRFFQEDNGMDIVEIEGKVFEPWKLGLEEIGENNYLGIVVWKKNGKVVNSVYVTVNLSGEVNWNGMRNYFSPDERKEIYSNAESLITLANMDEWWLQFFVWEI